MEDFFLRAIIGGLGFALAAGPVGCFVVWRRMAYLGEAIAHAILLGIALGFLLEIEPMITVFVICFFFAYMLARIEQDQRISINVLLGSISHFALALGLLALAFMEHIRVDLISFLFGDILAIDSFELATIYTVAVIVCILVKWQWRNLLSITVNQDLAAVEGVPVEKTRLLLIMVLAMVIAIGMTIVGILLVIAMVIIPAAAARCLTRTPGQMVVVTTMIGCLAVVSGLYGSLIWDTPAGPSIIAVAGVIFFLANLIPFREK
ncbi:MAG: iron chelate uptake ABC transporter family permease subunit [Gammaproteobacteria bacterium]|nr:iron chelate uptake ABC transporter family permease subunit [Gammaproteobacteria bacterium]